MLAFLLSFANAQNNVQDEKVKSEAEKQQVSWKNTVHDFKEIPKGKPVTATFEYTNEGAGEIRINRVVSSCGCTVAEFSKDPVKPGQSGTISATFDAAKFGGFNKLVTVYMSDDHLYKLYLKGTVGEKPAKAGGKKR